MTKKLPLVLLVFVVLWVLFTLFARAQDAESNSYLVFDTSRDNWYPRTGLVHEWPMLDASAGNDILTQKGDVETWQGASGGCTNCPTGFICTCAVASNINKETMLLFRNNNSVTFIADAVPSANELVWVQTFLKDSAYQLTFQYRGAIGGAGETLSVTVRDGGSTDFYDFDTDTWGAVPVSKVLNNAPATWTTVVLYITVGSTTKTDYGISFAGTAATQQIYVDNIILQKLRATGPTSSLSGGLTLSVPVTADPLFTQTPYGTMKQGPSTPFKWGTWLDGTNDYLYCDDATCGAWADPPASFSAGCYQIILDDTAGSRRVLGKGTGAAAVSWMLRNNAGDGEAYVYTGVPSTHTTVASCFAAKQASSAVMSYTFSGNGTSTLSLFCDHLSDTSAVAVGPAGNVAGNFLIGYNGATYTPGSIGRCAFWNRPLTDLEAHAWTYPYFQPNTNGTTTYVRSCVHTTPWATCSTDRCRNSKPDTCEVDPQGVFAAFLDGEEYLRDNSFEDYVGDDSVPAYSRWTVVNVGTGNTTAYHANVKHGTSSLRMTLGDATGETYATSTCQTLSISSDLFVYGSTYKISGTAAVGISIQEYSDGACTVPVSVISVAEPTDIYQRWQTIGDLVPAAAWGGTTASYDVTFYNYHSTSDILVDMVSARGKSYHTPWVENPAGAVTTWYTARSLDLDNPLAQGTPPKYRAGFCAGGWIWTDWNDWSVQRGFLVVPPTAGLNNMWYLYRPALPVVGFYVYDQLGGHYGRYTYTSGTIIGTTDQWHAHHWKYIEGCYSGGTTPSLIVVKAHHYDAATETWYDWSNIDNTATSHMFGQSTSLYIGHLAGSNQPDAYFYKPFIVPYNVNYSNTFFNNGKLPPLPY